MLAEMEEQAAGSTEGAQMREMERKNGQLRQQLEEIDGQHSAEVEKKDKEVRREGGEGGRGGEGRGGERRGRGVMGGGER